MIDNQKFIIEAKQVSDTELVASYKSDGITKEFFKTAFKSIFLKYPDLSAAMSELIQEISVSENKIKFK